MRLRIKAYIVVGLIAVAAFIRGCVMDRKQPLSFTLPLQEETLSQTVVHNRHIAVRTHKELKTGYVPEGGSVVANVDKDGKIQLDIKNYGLTFRPVMGILVTDKLRLATGAQVGYWNRVELYVGGAGPKFVLYGGVGYRLDAFRWLQNTSVFVAYTSDKYIGSGVLLRF